MISKMNEIIGLLLLIAAIITAWSVLTPNHLYIG